MRCIPAMVNDPAVTLFIIKEGVVPRTFYHEVGLQDGIWFIYI